MATTAKSVTTLEIGEEGSSFAIPVSLKKIKSKSDVALELASPDGNVIETRRYDLVTGEEIVDSDSIRRGIFTEKPKKSVRASWGGFKEVKPEDLEVIEETTKIGSFVVEHFIPLKDVPFERVMDAYFIAPIEGMTTKSLVLFARALKRKKVAGVFKMVKTSRQYLAVVYEHDGGLLVNTLAFSGDFGDVREAAESLRRDTVKISKGEQELADMLVDALTTDAAVLDRYEDDLIPLKAELVEKAIAGKELPKPRTRKEREPATDDGLEARLRETRDMIVKASPPQRRGERAS